MTTNMENNKHKNNNKKPNNLKIKINITTKKVITKKFHIPHKNKITFENNCNSIEKESLKEQKLKLMERNDYELNELQYEDALKKDKRTFFQLYLSLIKTKHLLLFSFFQYKDYNSLILKIYIFFSLLK